METLVRSLSNLESYESSHTNAVGARVFVAMELTGGGGLLFILATALLSRRVKRLSTWYSFCASWIFSCISYSLLSFAGQQTGPEPEHALCIVQAALIYAAPALTSSTTLSLVIHMFMSFRFILLETAYETSTTTLMILLITPYSVWLVMFLGVLVYGLQNPTTIRRVPRGTYCDSTNIGWSGISSTIVILNSVSLMAIQVVLAIRLRRNWKTVARFGPTVTTAVRVMFFSFFGILALGASLAYVITPEHHQVFDILIASIPLLAVLIFGTQMDLVHVWKFWDRHPLQASDSACLRPLSQHSYVSVPLREPEPAHHQESSITSTESIQ